MASINSLMSSSSSGVSSLYGNKNIISGLASGMDTEAMIENSIAGYKAKIQNLMNDQTKLTWKQDSYRSVTDKLIALSEKYTSYRSKTNLTSNGFFTKAVKTSTNGTYASKIAATGKTSSDVQINGVKKLATAATYRVSVKDLTNLQSTGNVSDAIDWGVTKPVDATSIGGAINWNEKVNVSDITGSMTINVDSDTISLSFTNDETKDITSADDLAKLINKKLEETEVTSGKKGDQYLKAVVENGNIVLNGAGENEHDGVYISSANGDIVEKLGIETTSTFETGHNVLKTDGVQFAHQEGMDEILSGKSFSVTLDGVTKKIALGQYQGLEGEGLRDKVIEDLKNGLADNFGDKVKVQLTSNNELVFGTTSQHSTLKVSSNAGSYLGMENDLTNYLNTGSSLEKLLGAGKLTDDMLMKPVGDVKASEDDPLKGSDNAGNMVARDSEAGPWYRVNTDGEKLYDLKINGKSIAVSAKSSMDSVINAINDSEAGVKVSYSQMTNQFTFTATETGAAGKIDFDDGLAATLFGKRELNVEKKDGDNEILLDGSGNRLKMTDDKGTEYYILKRGEKYYRADEGGVPLTNIITVPGKRPEKVPIELTEDEQAEAMSKSWKGYTSGQDAELNVTVNGENMTLTRSSNVVNIDGMSVTLKGTFNEGMTDEELKNVSGEKAVTFTSSADADTIVDAVKSFVEQVNDILSSVHEAYSTKPNGTYAPLTDEERADMSESEIKTYEEKAKSGLLFGDRDLSRLYNDLRKAVIGSGTDVGILRDIGITNSYANGVTSLELDEDKLRDALAADPDKVRSIFTKSKENGASSDGLMANVSKVLDRYASTKYGDYGLLVKKAGTKTKSLSLMDNTIQKQIDSYDTQIENWKLKMSDKIDYYTRQFSALEQLINTMNSQSSALSGLMGG